MLGEPNRDRRTERHEATKAEILEAAWELARSEGLAALSLRDVARKVGMRPPSLYSYFDCKNAIYDAMFAEGSEQFIEAGPWDEMNDDPRHDLGRIVDYFVRFCAADMARYQLLFQRTIPGFEPSPESFAMSQASLARLGEQLKRCGITDRRAVDLFTALGTGLADQQISNDPGGDRWIGLIDDAVEMFFDYMAKTAKPKAPAKGKQTR